MRIQNCLRYAGRFLTLDDNALISFFRSATKPAIWLDVGKPARSSAGGLSGTGNTRTAEIKGTKSETESEKTGGSKQTLL